jgi:transcriptional regulator with XRE-family HTH domain
LKDKLILKIIMVQIPKDLHEKIKTIRKSLHFSIHDCAKLLGIPQGNYLAFEKGEQQLSLPDLEILALYFGLPIKTLFKENSRRLYQLTLLHDNIRSHYQLLRQKIIRTQLVLERKAAGFTLETLQEATGIPLETLQTYEQDGLPIPIDDLQNICNHIGKRMDIFFPGDGDFENLLGVQEEEMEFPDDQPDPDSEESLEELLTVLKKVPKEEQAEIAKALLNKLRSL